MKKRHLTPEEQADVDFLLKTPGLKVRGEGGFREIRLSTTCGRNRTADSASDMLRDLKL